METKERVEGTRATVIDIIGRTGIDFRNSRLKGWYYSSQGSIGWTTKNSHQKCDGPSEKRRHSRVNGMRKRGSQIKMIFKCMHIQSLYSEKSLSSIL
ncbi:hypothetical protein FGO68_gene1023 [Halteria grandinella]|uniref:Uncharacterized protein n=1 Tax=Halteria grandinella TaxID=5974 RepID=A0A8J8SUG9_HALGN|nr:hypothetical protein FGO68_gene1023 [Halteria grandinella]